VHERTAIVTNEISEIRRLVRLVADRAEVAPDAVAQIEPGRVAFPLIVILHR
jgi:predicted RNA-binding protein YlxR (DUF448 family)